MAADEQRGRPLRASATFLREHAGGLTAAWLTTAVCAFVYAEDAHAHVPGGDGFYSWIWARSLVFDHDVDFANDYALCGDPSRVGLDPGTGHLDNPYYIGPALVWAPLLAALRLVIRLAPDASDMVRGACVGPLAKHTLAVAPVCAGLTVWLAYLVARRFSGAFPAALAALLLGLGTNLVAYATVLASYSHVFAALAFACLFHATVRASESPRSLSRWALCGLAVSACSLQRLPDTAVALVPLAALISRKWTVPTRAWLAAAVAFALPATVGVALTALAYRHLYGTVSALPQGKHYLHLAHAHPFLALFGPHGGFFYATPLLWLAVPGAWRLVRARASRTLALSCVLTFAIVLFVGSAALDWHGGGTYGARRLVVLTAFFVVATAAAIDALATWALARPARALAAAAVGLGLPFLFANVGAVWGLPRGSVPIQDGASQGDLYGRGTQLAWGIIDERIGDLAVLPACALFRLRYGLPMNRWRAATADHYYTRNFRNLDWVNNAIPLRAQTEQSLVTGMRPTLGGLLVTQRRSTLVFSAGWPFATHVVPWAMTERPVTLRVGLGTWRGVVWGGSARLEPGEAPASRRIALPAGVFDSGLDELVFEIDDPAAGLVLSGITLEDDTVW